MYDPRTLKVKNNQNNTGEKHPHDASLLFIAANVERQNNVSAEILETHFSGFSKDNVEVKMYFRRAHVSSACLVKHMRTSVTY